VTYDANGHYVDVLAETSVKGVVGVTGVSQKVMILEGQEGYNGPDVVSDEVYGWQKIAASLQEASYVQAQVSMFKGSLSDGQFVGILFLGSPLMRAIYFQHRYEQEQYGFIKTLIASQLDNEDIAELNAGDLSGVTPVTTGVQLGHTGLWIFTP
jgi:hypothetical protein